MGVVQGNSVVSIRSKEDMMDVWKDIRKGTKVVLWCDGLRAAKRKRQTPQMDEEDSDEEGGICIKPKRAKKMEEREDKVHVPQCSSVYGVKWLLGKCTPVCIHSQKEGPVWYNCGFD